MRIARGFFGILTRWSNPKEISYNALVSDFSKNPVAGNAVTRSFRVRIPFNGFNEITVSADNETNMRKVKHNYIASLRLRGFVKKQGRFGM